MSDDVAAVLAESIADTGMILYVGDDPKDDGPTWQAQEALAALTAAGYAVVRLPEGVAVAHGARLVPHRGAGGVWACFAIEDTP